MSADVKTVKMCRSGACVDLRSTFGDRYKISRDQSYLAERAEFRSAASAWLMIIPCRFGHIYPHGGRMLAVHTTSPSRRRRLMSLDCASLNVDGDRESTLVFDVVDFTHVASIVLPKRRRRLSPDQRAANIERLAMFQFQPRRLAR
jgi:hypothetical protein